jgi:hypothetical protein
VAKKLFSSSIWVNPLTLVVALTSHESPISKAKTSVLKVSIAAGFS